MSLKGPSKSTARQISRRALSSASRRFSKARLGAFSVAINVAKLPVLLKRPQYWELSCEPTDHCGGCHHLGRGRRDPCCCAALAAWSFTVAMTRQAVALALWLLASWTGYALNSGLLR